jgi:hypothetical protein
MSKQPYCLPGFICVGTDLDNLTSEVECFYVPASPGSEENSTSNVNEVSDICPIGIDEVSSAPHIQCVNVSSITPKKKTSLKKKSSVARKKFNITTKCVCLKKDKSRRNKYICAYTGCNRLTKCTLLSRIFFSVKHIFI